MLEIFIITIIATFIGFCVGYSNVKLSNKIAKRKKTDVDTLKYKKRILKKILENHRKESKK